MARTRINPFDHARAAPSGKPGRLCPPPSVAGFALWVAVGCAFWALVGLIALPIMFALRLWRAVRGTSARIHPIDPREEAVLDELRRRRAASAGATPQ